MVASGADRRRSRSPRATEVFGDHADAALDALALLDLAWHDCYGELSPPDQVIDDVWVVGNGDLGNFISAAHLAVIDFSGPPHECRRHAPPLTGRQPSASAA